MVKGGCAWPGGGCVAGETATAAGGTHPTEMHSCVKNNFDCLRYYFLQSY